MQRDAIERALYELTTDRATRTSFGSDPTAALGRYHLDDESIQAILDFDIAALQAFGVNPMLSWGFWMTFTGRSRADYIAALGRIEVTQ